MTASPDGRPGVEAGPGRRTGAKTRDLRAVWAIVALWAAGEIAISAVAPVFSERAPELALWLRPNSARAHVVLAERLLSQGRAKQAASQARLALRTEPLDVEALRTLGLAEDRLGHFDQAARILTFAGRRSWRDGPTHLWLFEQRLKRGEYESAYQDADSLMRRVPQLRPPFFKVFIAAAVDPRSIGPLTERLAARPEWREAFLTALVASPDGLVHAGAVFSSLRASKAPPTLEETGLLLTALAKAGDYPDVERQWGLLAPASYAARASGVMDGAFDGAKSPQPFAWDLAGGDGFEAGVEDTGDPRHGGALHVIYDGFSEPSPVRQMLLLAPGAYRLEMSERSAMASDVDDRLRWSVSCLDGGTAETTARAGGAGVGRWGRVTMDFRIPAQKCSAQQLQLQPSPGERRESLDVWYDDVRISRTGGP